MRCSKYVKYVRGGSCDTKKSDGSGHQHVGPQASKSMMDTMNGKDMMPNSAYVQCNIYIYIYIYEIHEKYIKYLWKYVENMWQIDQKYIMNM